MLAYRLARSLADCWRGLDLTVEEGLDELNELCVTDLHVRGELAFSAMPLPRASPQALLAAAGVVLPAALPGRTGNGADTRRKLQTRRRPRRNRKATVDTNGSATAAP